MTTRRVTVLLPVFNAEGTLRAAVESILAQCYTDFELLLVDDGSRDGSAEIARECAARDARVRPQLHSENCGLIRRLNEGLALAQGEYVARMDSDDEALPGRLAAQVDFLDEHPDVAVVGTWAYQMGATPANDRLVRLPYTSKQIAETLPRENCIYHPTVMMRRAEILALGGYRPEFPHAEDYELWLRVSRRHRLACIAQPFLRYRLSTGGVTFNKRWELLRSVYMAQEAHRRPDQPLEKTAAAADARLAATHRQKFFAGVMRAAVEDFIRLQRWADALTLIGRCAGETGAAQAAELKDWVVGEETAAKQGHRGLAPSAGEAGFSGGESRKFAGGAEGVSSS